MTMKKLLTIILLCWGFSLIFAQESEKPASEKQSKELVFVVNATAKIWDNISAKDLKKIYLGKTKNLKGIRLRPTLRHDEDLNRGFLDKYVGKSPRRFKSYWIKKVFSRGGEKPKEIGQIADLLDYISEHEGAIGIAWSDELTGEEKSVKTLEIAPRDK